MKKKMFYGASMLIFQNAKSLRRQPTHAEMILWNYLRNNLLGYKFRRQHPVGNFIADFYCHPLKLVIEVDGSIHEKEDVRKNDEERQKTLEADGIKVVRVTNDEILKDVEEVIKRIIDTIPPNPLKGDWIDDK